MRSSVWPEAARRRRRPSRPAPDRTMRGESRVSDDRPGRPVAAPQARTSRSPDRARRLPSRAWAGPGDRASLPVLGQRIAVARDEAFAFAYPLVLDGWRRAGAEVLPFSPLADESPSPVADAIYLPGGYPELHAGRLAGAGRFIEGLRAAAARGAVVYGECGGYMVLGDSLVDADGVSHAMAGLLPVATTFAERRLTLGYRTAHALAAAPSAAPARDTAGTSSTTRGSCARTATRRSSGAPTRAGASSAGRAPDR